MHKARESQPPGAKPIQCVNRWDAVCHEGAPTWPPPPHPSQLPLRALDNTYLYRCYLLSLFIYLTGFQTRTSLPEETAVMKQFERWQLSSFAQHYSSLWNTQVGFHLGDYTRLKFPLMLGSARSFRRGLCFERWHNSALEQWASH